MKYLRNTLCIDPGWNTATSYWDDTKTEQPLKTYLLKADLRLSKIQRINNLSDILNHNITLYDNIDLCIIEGVEFWDISLKSVTSAKRRDLIFLSYLVGSYINVLHGFGIEVKEIVARDWKGQMSDDAVKRRIERALDRGFDSVHEYSAVGMGLSEMGVL